MDKVNVRLVAGRYAIREILGVGGMGVVYRADDLARGHAVAIKLLHHPQHAQQSGTRAAAVRPGAERLAGDPVDHPPVDHPPVDHPPVDHPPVDHPPVDHPNVVSVFDAGTSADGTPFWVMELVRGVPLDELVHTEGPFALWRATAIVGQLLAGLQSLHDAGFVHGDVKSGNVLVDAAGGDAVKLIDLGLARTPEPLDPAGGHLASGTPEYMAPEVVRGDGTIPASDIYGAGVVLYQLLTGTTPFEGGAAREILRRQLEDVVVPPSLRYPDRTIPGALERAVMVALDKDPAARHASARAFAEAIAAASPPEEPPPSPGWVRPVFSTEAPTQDFRPREPASPAGAGAQRPAALAAPTASVAAIRIRAERRGTLATCRRSTAIDGPWAWSTRRPR